MAKGNLPACLAQTLAFEGGYVDDPRDPGGATNMGITLAVLQKWRGGTVTKADVKALPVAEATQIYEAKYWRPIRGDDLPKGVDLATMDYGVNSGVWQAGKDLQRVVGAPVDGRVGPVTLKAVLLADRPVTIKGLCARRLGLMRSLKIWDTFGKGWSKRVATIEAASLAMVLTKAQIEAEAKQASTKAAGQLAAGGAVGGGAVADHGTLTGLPPALILAVALAIVAALTIRIIINRQRAAALAAVAKEA